MYLDRSSFTMVSYSSTASPEDIKLKETSSLVLHSVTKPQSKPYSSKKSQPLVKSASPTQPRVYKVKPIHFRELVQQLTGAPHLRLSQPQLPNRIQISAPPPLPIAHRVTVASANGGAGGGLGVAKLVEKSASGAQESSLPIEMLLSPNFRAWWNSFPPLSPRTSQLRST